MQLASRNAPWIDVPPKPSDRAWVFGVLAITTALVAPLTLLIPLIAFDEMSLASAVGGAALVCLGAVLLGLYAVPRGSWMGVTAVWLATAVFLSVGIVTAFVDNEANDLAAEQQRTIQATVAQAVEANAEEYAPPVPSPRFPEVLFK